jgi:acetoin utilization protein AcuC
VAYVDVDVHHGDGVEAAFYGDPRVLTVSCTRAAARCSRHRLGRPGRLRRRARHNVNVPLPMGTGDAGWLRAFDAVVPQVLRAFAPQVMLTQHAATPTRSTRWRT